MLTIGISVTNLIRLVINGHQEEWQIFLPCLRLASVFLNKYAPRSDLIQHSPKSIQWRLALRKSRPQDDPQNWPEHEDRHFIRSIFTTTLSIRKEKKSYRYEDYCTLIQINFFLMDFQCYPLAGSAGVRLIPCIFGVPLIFQQYFVQFVCKIYYKGSPQNTFDNQKLDWAF